MSGDEVTYSSIAKFSSRSYLLRNNYMLISLKMKENICIYRCLLAMTANNGISSLGCSCKVFFFIIFFNFNNFHDN